MACKSWTEKKCLPYGEAISPLIKRPDGDNARPKEKWPANPGPRKSVYNGETNSPLKRPDGDPVWPKKNGLLN